MSEEEKECKEIIYDLTELKSREHDKINKLVNLYRKKIAHLEEDVDHLKVLLQSYASFIDKIGKVLDVRVQSQPPEALSKDLAGFGRQMERLCREVEALKEIKAQEGPIVVEKTVEVEKMIEVVKEIEI